MPANGRSRDLKYKLTLAAVAASGKRAKAKTIAVLRPRSTQLSAGAFHTCALVSTGQIECWGDNANAQLGVGNRFGPENCSATLCATTPHIVALINNGSQVSAGAYNTCAVLLTGHIECWGNNEDGQLGDGTNNGPERCSGAEFSCSSVPIEVHGIGDAVQVATGSLFACGVIATGHIACWGSNEHGALGDGNEVNSYTPVEVQGISDAAQVSANSHYACALLATGHVVCWGFNEYGRLGDGNETNSDAPVEVRGIGNAIEVATGWAHACALLATGRVACWGHNDWGQLGDGTSSGPEGCGAARNEYAPCSTTPVEVHGLVNATQVAPGEYHTCALLSSGHIECWGYNFYGELGDGTEKGPESCGLGGAAYCSRTPVEVQNISTATQVASGGSQTCALATGEVECWGQGYQGQLGDGMAKNSDTPAEVTGSRQWASG